MDRPGTCIILDKKYNIANSSCHFGSCGSIWTGPSPKKYYMDRSFWGPYTAIWHSVPWTICYIWTVQLKTIILYNIHKQMVNQDNRTNALTSNTDSQKVLQRESLIGCIESMCAISWDNRISHGSRLFMMESMGILKIWLILN